MIDGLLALAVAAGMLAAVNPCGFALLPAYLGLFVWGPQGRAEGLGSGRAVGRALRASLALGVGFVAVFTGFGLVIAPVASGVQRHLPWFTVVFGVFLALIGASLLIRGELPSLPRSGRHRPRRELTTSFWSIAGFGAGYALASLTCTIAPFLAIVVAGARRESVAEGVLLYVAYAAGMALVVAVISIAVALARSGVVTSARRAGRWVPRVGGLLALFAGLYVAYYGWWELRVLSGGAVADPVIDAAAAVQQWLAAFVERLAPPYS
jgi:cytochrome c biogenesis protein CcdA